MDNKEIKKLIVDNLQQHNALCNQHSEDISAMKTELPLIRKAVEDLVVQSKEWMQRTVLIEKDVVAIKASKKASSIILGIALTVIGILAGVFGKSFVGLFENKKEDKPNEKYIYMYSDIDRTADRLCKRAGMEEDSDRRSSEKD